jgi:hypothetical protein
MGFSNKSTLFQPVKVAKKQITFFVTQMHSAAFAVFEIFTSSTFSLLGPGTVAENLVTIIPYIHKIVIVDISLYEI